MPWCSACGTFAEPFKTIAKNLEDDNIEVGAVNCAKEGTLCGEHFAVTSYPMIMMVTKPSHSHKSLHHTSPRSTRACLHECAACCSAVS